MTVTFLGTRGNIAVTTRAHRRHAATLVAYNGTRVMIDCGDDWLSHVHTIAPDAIIITHGHNDHVGGLRNGAPCPVYATTATWKIIRTYPIAQQQVIKINQPFTVGALSFEACFVYHSLRAPAVGYRITAGTTTIFCVHDVLALRNQAHTLRDVVLYIGDGASVARPIVQRSKGQLVGHTPIVKQLAWCARNRVSYALFTHCGTGLVTENQRLLAKRIAAYGDVLGVDAGIAHDGMQITVLKNHISYA